MKRTKAARSGVVGVYEAKTHLTSLLDRVRRGEVITITRHGVAIARLGPVPTREGRARDAEDLRAQFLRFQEAHPLEGLTTRDLVVEGRRR